MKVYEEASLEISDGAVSDAAWEVQQVFVTANLPQPYQGVENVMEAYRDGAFTKEQALVALSGYYAVVAATVQAEMCMQELTKLSEADSSAGLSYAAA